MDASLLLDLSVIIVSHGHEHFLVTCLSSLIPALSGLAAEVILVDNLGRGHLSNLIDRSQLPVVFLENQTPQGFAWNTNHAVRSASGRYLLFLNPDTQLLSGHLATALTLLEQDPTVGAVGCKLLNPDGSRQENPRRFPTLPEIVARGLYTDKWLRPPQPSQSKYPDDESHRSLIPVDWVMGAFMLLARSHFESVGGMDEHFFLYYEDVDLCYRLRRCGLTTCYFPGITVLHHHHRASAARPFGSHWRWHVQSVCRYFWKHRYLFRPY